MNQQNTDLPIGTSDWQNLFGFIRVILFIGLPFGFAAYAGVHFHGVNPTEIAFSYRFNYPGYFRLLTDRELVLFALFINPYSLRYLLAPYITMLAVLTCAAFYIKDIYALPDLGMAFHFILASMFTIRYPSLVVDKGQPQLLKNQNLMIDKMGGPGFVMVEPGSAAIFRHLRRPSRSVLPTTYFLAPFEEIAYTIDLEEQQCKKDQIRAMTRDGIQVMLRDLHIRYRIKHRDQNGVPVRRTIRDPNPLEADALNRMMWGLSVDTNGLDPWTVAVERLLVGEVTDFIAMHKIDYLTAPRSNSPTSRAELRNQMFYHVVQRFLRNLGAELLWIDVGHIDIIEPSVDDQRTNLWASDWVGDANLARAYGEAKRLAYQELGRAEAQAELLMSISEALREVNLSADSSANIRKIFLARTAQVLNTLKARSPNERETNNDRLS